VRISRIRLPDKTHAVFRVRRHRQLLNIIWRSYVEKGVVFTPQALSSMGKALQETTNILGISGEKQRQAVARFIIRLAGEDNSLDTMALRDRAVAALGGMAYSALCASQTSNPHAAAE
jgi:hypothetical protein